MNKGRDIFVSVSVILLPGQLRIGAQLKELSRVLGEHYAHSEILVLDTPSCVGIEEEMATILKETPKIRYIRLFNNALFSTLSAAGMENAIGDIIVTGNLAYLTSENIIRAVDRCCEGYDVVNGICSYTRPLFYAIGSAVFRLLFGNMINYHLPKTDTFFRCISRRILNAALNTPHFHRFVFLRLSNAGGRQSDLEIDVPRDIYLRLSRKNNFSSAISLLIFNSTAPLRIVNGIALAGSMLCILFALYSVLIHLIKTNVVEGWTTLMLIISSLFFLLFLVVAFCGEYLVRIIVDRSETTPYNVVYEKHSSVMLNLNELNIRENSEANDINQTQTGRDR